MRKTVFISNLVRNEKGFTLIEVMIALFVATLVLGGYIGTNIIMQKNGEEMNERTVALQNANQVIEQMRNESTAGTFPANVVNAYPNNSHPGGFNNLTNEIITVSYADTTANPLTATVTVTWLSYAMRQKTETVQTYITQR